MEASLWQEIGGVAQECVGRGGGVIYIKRKGKESFRCLKGG